MSKVTYGNGVFRVRTDVEIPEEQVRNLLVSAFEGGSNYWYMIEEHIYGGGRTEADFDPGGECYNSEYRNMDHYLLPFVYGCALIISTAESDAGDDGKRYTLDAKALKRGLRLLESKYPEHWRNFIDDNDDAETADVFLQCCLFGEVVYA